MMENLPEDNIKDYELIRRYFDFELTEEELAAFMDRMENDEVFLERMRIFQASDEEIHSLEQQQTVKDSTSTAKTIQLKPIVTSRTRWFRAIAAIVILALGMLFVLRLFSNNSNDVTALAQDYWEEEEKLVFSNLRSSDEQTANESRLVNASNLFKNKDFEGAIQALSEMEDSDTLMLYHKAALLKGASYLEQQEYTAAIDQFQTVIDHPNNEHNDLAYWYQTLAYLQNGQIEPARKNLDIILTQRYAIPKATKLKKQLEENNEYQDR